MNKKTLLATVATIATFSVQAQTKWIEPAVPGVDPATLSGTEAIYMYNVDADAFVTSGMNWNTNAIATRLTNGDTSISTPHSCKVTYNISQSTFTISSNAFPTAIIGSNNGVNDVWADFNDKGTWSNEDAHANTYLILHHNGTERLPLDVSYTYGGHLTTHDGKGFTEWAFIPEERITDGSYALYKAKKKLYNIYKACVDDGIAGQFATSLNNALNSYNSSSATCESLQSVTKTLLKEVGPYLTSKTVNANALLNNADMVGTQKTTGWTTTEMSFAWADIEKYHSPLTLSQSINDAPAGFYTVISHSLVRQDGSAQLPTLSVTGTTTVSTTMENMTTITWGCNANGGNNWKSANGNVIPDGMKSAGQALAHGDAVVVASDVPCTGNLSISLAVTASDQWFNTQGFELEYKTCNTYLAPYKNKAKDFLDNYPACDNAIKVNLQNAIQEINSGISDPNEALTLSKNIDKWVEEGKLTFDRFDMTDHIVNPSLSATTTNATPTGWTGTTTSWRWTQGTGNTVMECWNGTASDVNFNMYQTISGLPEGVYEVGADMLYSTDNENGANFLGGECGLYAVSSTGEAYQGVNVNSNTLAPHKLLIYVGADGNLTIGVKNICTASARWFACDNFTLTRRLLNNAIADILTDIPAGKAQASLVNDMNEAKTALQASATTSNFEALQTAICKVRKSIPHYARVNAALKEEKRVSNAGLEAQTEYARRKAVHQAAYDNGTFDGDGTEEELAIRLLLPEAIIATDGNLTALITNNGFESGNTNGWTVGASSDTGARSTSSSTYASTGSKGNYLFNTWWQGIPLTQDIGYLPAGFYNLNALLTSDGGTIFLTTNKDHSQGEKYADKGVMNRATHYFVINEPTKVVIGAVGGTEAGEFTANGYFWYKADDFQLSVANADEIISEDITVTAAKGDYYARGSQDIFGRVNADNAPAGAERGLCYSATNAEPTIDDSRSTEHLTYCGEIYKISGLTPSTAYYVRPYVKIADKTLYGDAHKVYTLPAGKITYNIRTSGESTYDANVTNATKLLVEYWNRYTSISGYNVNAGFVNGVPTAECSYGGYMSYGTNTSYQQCGTAMHESMHGIGVGTTERWSLLCNGKTWTGPRVNEFLQFWENSENATFYGDRQHGWCSNGVGGLSYTINGAQEDAYSDLQRTANSLLTQACGEDGLPPTGGSWYTVPYYSFEQDDNAVYNIYNKETGKYLVDNGTLSTASYDSESKAAAANVAGWYVRFDAVTQTYNIINKNSGRYLSHENYAWGLNLYDKKINMPKTVTRDSYWLTTPTKDGRCLAADLSCGYTDLTGGAPSTAWVISRVKAAVRTGDVNNDGVVNIADVGSLVNIILGKAADIHGTADVDNSGSINIADVDKLVKMILGK